MLCERDVERVWGTPYGIAGFCAVAAERRSKLRAERMAVRTQGEEKGKKDGGEEGQSSRVLPIQMKQSEKSEDGSPRVIRLSRRGDGNNRP